MTFLIVETFRAGNPDAVGERYGEHGRLLCEGVQYLDSWMEVSGERCYQLMEAVDREILERWTSRWDDLVHFEVIEVQSSAEYWRPRT